MIIYNSEQPLKVQIQANIQELKDFKNLYNNRIKESCKGVEYINKLLGNEQCTQISSSLEKNSNHRNKIFEIQISKIDRNINELNNLLESIDTLSKSQKIKIIGKYNKKYKEIKKNIYINNLKCETNNTFNYKYTTLNNKESNVIEPIEPIKKEEKNVETSLNTNNNKSTYEVEDCIVDNKNEVIENTNTTIYNLENNDTLLISEILNKVILPYTKEEVLEIFNNNKNEYNKIEDVIEGEFTRNFSDYKFQFWSRYNETIKLATERAGFKLSDSITLAIEVMGKRYLHPAIISACRNLDELDVYLDCLEKNELDDFKIFKIKYELHPILAKQVKDSRNIFNLFGILNLQNSKKNKESKL